MAPKRILVTGANRGIGFSIVQALAERENSLIILVAARNLTSAEDAISALKQKGLEARFEAVELDVNSDERIETCLSCIEKNHGSLDVLINNAGIAPIPSAEGHTHLRSSYNTTLNTNLTSFALLTSLSTPLLLRSQHPRVIDISSGRAGTLQD